MRRSWSVQDAKARFSKMLAACEDEGPQIVTKRGVAAALVPIEEWRMLSSRAGLRDLLLSDEARSDDFAAPPRNRIAVRKPPKF